MEKGKRALVVGGAGGLGAAICQTLLDKGYSTVYVADRNKPAAASDALPFIHLNLATGDLSPIKPLVDEVDALVITAGIGRVAYLQNLTDAEVKTSFSVNAIAPVEIIRLFWERLASKDDFDCAVVTSIAGHVSSPLYSIYSATKGALALFTESINAELAAQGFSNRILEVSPGRIKGTRFHGEKRDQLDLVAPLAEQIVERMRSKETLFIPDYEEVYKGVLERYHADPDAFGLQSAQYKIENGAVEDKPRTVVGYITGCFDLFHIGHLNILKRAKENCDYLVVGVHTDGSHKGKELAIPLDERMEIVRSLSCVDEVIECSTRDIDDYDRVKFNRLFVGDDYKGSERFQEFERILNPLGVEIVYFPYTKGTSSTQLRAYISES